MVSNQFFVLVVDADPSARAGWREAVPRAGMDRQVYTVGTSSEAIEYMLKVRRSPFLSTPGVVMVESDRSPDAVPAIVRWLRTQQSLAWVVPVALVDVDRVYQVADLYQAGARSCLASPSTVEDRASLLTEIRAYWQGLNMRPF